MPAFFITLQQSFTSFSPFLPPPLACHASSRLDAVKAKTMYCRERGVEKGNKGKGKKGKGNVCFGHLFDHGPPSAKTLRQTGKLGERRSVQERESE